MEESGRDTITSSSSTIRRPTTINVPNRGTPGAEKTNQNIHRNEESLIPTANLLMVFWMWIVSQWRIVSSALYESTVGFLAGFVADVLSHPRLNKVMVDMIVAAINAFMDQEDIGTKLDDAARRVIYGPDKARETATTLGKEIVPMVTGFVGGVASSLKPESMKKRSAKKRRKKSQILEKSLRKQINEEFDRSNLTTSQGFRSHGYSSAGVSMEEEEEEDWFFDSKKKWKRKEIR